MERLVRTMTDWLQHALSPARLNGLTLRNRVLKAATFEGMSVNGRPTGALINFHRDIGAGGTAMTTVAYCAAEADGRVMENMLYMHEGTRSQLQELTDAVHSTGAAVSGQLAHCGHFSKNKEFRGKRPLGPSFGFNLMGMATGRPLAGAMNQADMDHFVSTFADAARFMKSVGFDAIEIHFGHGYGLSQFISPLTNRRKDNYGGSLHNRMRLPLRVLAAVREAVGDDFPLLGKISMEDGKEGGVTVEQSVEIAALLEQGGIDAIIPSSGTSSMNPMLMFRGDSLAQGMLEHTENPIVRLGMRMLAGRMFKSYPYHDLYLLEHARRIRDRVQCAVAYIGGCGGADNLAQLVAEGFEFVQLGRPLFYDPNFVQHTRADSHYRNGCTHCNRCAGMIEAPGGVRCTERPNAA
jgi:2,4-dienoyl-CoA reductase-like NADH-dependent reductase (Old Yellow Enzyme family)